MSNRKHRRQNARYDAHRIGKVCVFCELAEIAHHIEMNVVPILRADDQADARAAVASIRDAAASLEAMASSTRPPGNGPS
jgi:hypothetical protein